MAAPRKHHLVPQFYQRAFARRSTTKRWEGLVVDLDHPERGGVHNIENVFVQRDFNTVTTDEGDMEFVVEEFLTDYVDTPAAPAVQALRQRNFPLIEPWRDALALFMATQLSRGRATRESLTEFITELQHTTMKMMARTRTDEQWVEAIGYVPDAKTIERLANSDKHFDIKPTNAHLLKVALGPGPEIAGYLAQRTWTFVQFEQPCLLTAENPVVHINPSGETPGYGVATAEQMYLPVSPTQGLLLSHPWSDWPPARVNGSRSLAERLNWSVLCEPNNRRFLLHPDTDSHPLPGPTLLHDGAWWPWGADPNAEPPAYMEYLARAKQRREGR